MEIKAIHDNLIDYKIKFKSEPLFIAIYAFKAITSFVSGFAHGIINKETLVLSKRSIWETFKNNDFVNGLKINEISKEEIKSF